MCEYQPLTDLRTKLRGAGHGLVDTDSAGVRVCPPPDSRIVVATQADVTLFPAYRRHFFLCQPGAEAILARAGCPPTVCRQWTNCLPGWTAARRDLLAGPGRGFSHA